ncbi:MAG: hypothetical protein JNJ60_20760 [Rhodocyclaceae bacterium]|nr:hypothetical protein [Rhodocyclaceae bacterium]
MKLKHQAVFAALVLSMAGIAVAESVKDVVIDRIAAPAASSHGRSAAGDAMAVSVLLESPDGTLSARSTNTLFQTGDRFRVKLLSSRDAKVSLYNTNPRGELSSTPVWQGSVKAGLETISPRLRLDGTSGVDLLHVVMEPKRESGVVTWLTSWLRAGKESSKDIRVDVQNTDSTTYLVNNRGEGLVTTVSIAHR